MIYLELSRKHFNAWGIILFDCDWFDRLKALIKFLISFLLVGPGYCWCSGAFIYQHRYELETVTMGYTTFFGCLAGSVEYLLLKLNEAKIGQLIMDFQEMITKGMRRGILF